MKSTSKSMIFSMAIRNIVRNTRRSLLSACTIFIVVTFACIMTSFSVTRSENMETNIINQSTGDIRVRNQQYADNERVTPFQFFIPQTDELLSFIKTQKGVTGAEPQINVIAVVDPNNEAIDTTIIGLNFETSRFFTDRNTKIISGKIPSLGDKNAVVITPFMANHFNLKVGDKFTAWWSMTAIGQNAVTLTVSGIATINNGDFSGLNVFMDWKNLSEVLRLNGNTLEILVHTEEGFSNGETEKLIASIQNYAKKENFLEVKEWDEVSTLVQLIDLQENMNTYMTIFFFLMASTIIFNSTMMAVCERKKEIGALMSLGMEAQRIKNLFLLESALLAFMASLAGAVIGFIVVSIVGHTGINLLALMGGDSTGQSVSAWIYPNLSFAQYLFILLVMTSISTIACILPARMALRVQPSEALRTAE